MAVPILNLDTLANRPVVIIRDTECWLVTPDILPPLDAHRLETLSERWLELTSKPKREVSDEEQVEMRHLPDHMCRLVLEASDEILSGLSDRERMLIVQKARMTFHNGQQMPELAGLTTLPPANPSTGASSSPVSSASTEAIP